MYNNHNIYQSITPPMHMQRAAPRGVYTAAIDTRERRMALGKKLLREKPNLCMTRTTPMTILPGTRKEGYRYALVPIDRSSYVSPDMKSVHAYGEYDLACSQEWKPVRVERQVHDPMSGANVRHESVITRRDLILMEREADIDEYQKLLDLETKQENSSLLSSQGIFDIEDKRSYKVAHEIRLGFAG